MKDNCTDDSDRVDRNPRTGVHTTSYDDEPPSVAIVEAIAEIKETDVTDLDSLSESTAMDVAALDDLFQPTVVGAPRGAGRVEFVYENCEVYVFSYGRIEIKPLHEDN